MEGAGLLQLPFVIRRMKEQEEDLERERARAENLEAEARKLSEALRDLKTPTLFVEGDHDVQLFSAALERINRPKDIRVRPLGGTPNNPHTLLTALMKQGGINAEAPTLFLFDNDRAGRAAFNGICRSKNMPDGPSEINERAWAWVLPLSDEYQGFLKKWKLEPGSAFFPAEFLFPAEKAAALYRDILDASENPPEHPVQGDIWRSVMQDQERSIKLRKADAGTVDWFFSRGVHDGLKKLFAQKTQEQGLDTGLVDSVIQKAVEILVPQEDL